MLKKFIFLIIALFIFSLSGVFSKLASSYNFISTNFLFYYSISIIILFIYSLLWQKILKMFDLSVAYAGKGITIFFSCIWGIILFNEKITINMFIGIIVILLGVIMVVKTNE